MTATPYRDSVESYVDGRSLWQQIARLTEAGRTDEVLQIAELCRCVYEGKAGAPEALQRKIIQLESEG